MLTQIFNEQTTRDKVKKNLYGEYKPLALCHWFKARFDEHAASQGVMTLPSMCHDTLTIYECALIFSIPDFHFNYPNSILGELKPSLRLGSTHIPFLHFLATLLLPCGAVDAKVKKFTGNDLFGEASDDMTRAIHAFVHFSVAYSDNSILFCDLQGTLYSAHSSDKQVDIESFIESLYQGPSMQKG